MGRELGSFEKFPRLIPPLPFLREVIARKDEVEDFDGKLLTPFESLPNLREFTKGINIKKLLVSLVTVLTALSSSLAATYYVATTGSNSNAGTISSPFQTIQYAASLASAGDTIYIRGGTYRERVNVPASASGTSGNLTKFFAYTGETPVILGSETVTGWTHLPGSSNPIWQHTSWPYDSQQVFVDGAPLQQIGAGNTPQLPRCVIGSGLSDMTAGTFYLDTASQTLSVWLSDGSNPFGHTVEASARNYALDSRFASFIHVKGLTCRYSGNEEGWNELTVGPSSTVESCDVQWSDFGGVTLASNSQVINSIISNNGDVGVQAVGSAKGIRVANNIIANNNYRGFNTDWHCGGMKLIPEISGIVEGNDVGNNNGPGIWWDACYSGDPIIVRNNYVHGENHGDGCVVGQGLGIFIEISENALVYNNLVTDTAGIGIYISASNNTGVYHNTILGTTGYSSILVAGVPRPGCSWLPGGACTLTNNEVYNNILVSPANTWQYNDVVWTLEDASYPSLNNKLDYNLYYRTSGSISFLITGSYYSSLSAWQAATGLDTHSLNTNPLFASDGKHLSSSSPAIDQGLSGLGVSSDYDGLSRPQGTGYDIGAFEFPQCGVCHKGITLYFPCDSFDYARHIGHGDAAGPCGP